MNINRRVNAPPPQQQYAPQNPGPPMNYNRQQTAPVKKPIQHDTDVYVYLKKKTSIFSSSSSSRVTQSRSFQMLQGWISDSEKTVPTPVQPPTPASQPAPPANKSAGRLF